MTNMVTIARNQEVGRLVNTAKEIIQQCNGVGCTTKKTEWTASNKPFTYRPFNNAQVFRFLPFKIK
jgi:hypothetical protein